MQLQNNPKCPCPPGDAHFPHGFIDFDPVVLFEWRQATQKIRTGNRHGPAEVVPVHGFELSA